MTRPFSRGAAPNSSTTVDIIQALECIGCGRLEGPHPCIGVCQDQIVELVYASDYRDALTKTEVAWQRAKTMEALLKQLAWTTPRSGDWERSFRALQERARKVLGSPEVTQHPPR